MTTKPKRKSCLIISIIVCVILFLVILFTFDDILLQLGMKPYPPPVDAISDQNVDQVRQIRRLPQGGFGAKLAWSPDSRLLGVGNGGMVKLWEAATGKELPMITFQSEVSGLAFSPDSSVLAVGTNVASLYDVVTGRQIRAFSERVTLPNGWVLSGGMNVAFSPDGKILAGGMMGGTAVLWDVASGKTLSTFSDPSFGSPYSQVAFSPDGNILALAHSRVSLWNVTTGEMIRTLPAESEVVMFLADGKTLLTSNGLWDITTGKCTGECSGGSWGCRAFSSDGTLIAQRPLPLPGIGFSSPSTKISAGLDRDLGSDAGCPLAFSPDKRWLATGQDAIKLWGVPPSITPTTPMPLATTVARPSPIATPTTSRTGRIAYIVSDPSLALVTWKKDAIYLMNADGSQRMLVADKLLVSNDLLWSPNLSVSNNLLWSPDGTRIVFDALVDSNVSSIYIAFADGSGLTGLTRLTNCPQGLCNSPAWSPDGKRIAFKFETVASLKTFQGPQPYLYLMNRDGSQPTPLSGNMGIIRQIAWSPDGKRIALQDGCHSIRVVSTDGSVSGPLTECGGAAEAQYPAWSIDSRQIAFVYKRQSGGAFALYVMNADGSQQTRLAADLELVGSPAVWSPDGRRIAFDYIGKNQEGAIALINPDGSGMMRLTPDDLNTGEPAWSPDGKQIAFSVLTQKPMKADIYVVNADGSAITRLTNDPLSAHSPAWQPSSR